MVRTLYMSFQARRPSWLIMSYALHSHTELYLKHVTRDTI